MTTPNEQRAVIEEHVLNLFSGRAMTRSQMMAAMQMLVRAEGISSFHTAVPWKLSIADGRTIPGASYDLSSAAEDIYAQLQALGESYPLDASLMLSIDDTRFQEAITSRAKPRKGGLGA